MKKTLMMLIFVIFMASFILTNSAHADLYTIQYGTEVFNPVGGFIAAGNASASSPGQVYEVLTLQNKPSESGTRDTLMKALWSTLNAGGIAHTTTLVFGFGNNESGPIGTKKVDITALTMTFNLPNGSFQTFDLGSNTVSVYNYHQGASTAEASIQVILPFDFMTTYNADSNQVFKISSTINNTDDGQEIYFLSSGFTANPTVNPISIPPAVYLLSTGLIGLVGLRRRFMK